MPRSGSWDTMSATIHNFTALRVRLLANVLARAEFERVLHGPNIPCRAPACRSTVLPADFLTVFIDYFLWEILFFCLLSPSNKKVSSYRPKVR